MKMSGVGNFIGQMEIFIETKCVSSTNSEEKYKEEEEEEEKEMKENL